MFACKQPFVSEKTVAFSKHAWNAAYKPWIKIEIADTASLYNIFAVIRHTQGFRYNNLLLNYSFISPGDTAITTKVNLPLGENKNWYGDTLGDIIETRVKLNTKPQKLKAGNNGFVLEQLMPENPLQNILNVGVRVEKVNE
ncbi:hypothetical protein A9P82_02170 [Arachidicoccus ginsenosidimutans]|nr:hypothetical protein A9P82_02170 [Arachidicoccus sp. BS20]